MSTQLMQGNEACVFGAIYAGMRFFAGYPITPSTEIAEGCARELPKVGGHFVQMEDELGSMAAIIGASVAGAKSMTATSGPGFSLMQENIGYAAMAEVPCVVVDVQRSGPSTGLPTSPSQGDYMQARWGTHGDHPAIAVAPSSVLETYTEIVRCFNLAEKYRTPVVFLMDEIVGHLREAVELPKDGTIEVVDRARAEATGAYKTCYHVGENEWVPAMNPFGEGERYNITGLFHDEGGFPTNSNEQARALTERLLGKISHNKDDILKTELIMMDDADTAVLCYGGTKRAAMDAVAAARKNGIKAGIIRPVTVWPFPEEELLRVLPQLKRLVVAEHNFGQMDLVAQRVMGKAGRAIEHRFVGKWNGTLITPEEILAALGD